LFLGVFGLGFGVFAVGLTAAAEEFQQGIGLLFRRAGDFAGAADGLAGFAIGGLKRLLADVRWALLSQGALVVLGVIGFGGWVSLRTGWRGRSKSFSRVSGCSSDGRAGASAGEAYGLACFAIGGLKRLFC
jgi:hypothetical protein